MAANLPEKDTGFVITPQGKVMLQSFIRHKPMHRAKHLPPFPYNSLIAHKKHAAYKCGMLSGNEISS
ncbi:hypothetical protein [Saezia sanguinis]|uniref:hypothetical protein n=1 Tax=Saezia sanguinis TaxID=1965230 RepID=UPI0030DDB30C